MINDLISRKVLLEKMASLRTMADLFPPLEVNNQAIGAVLKAVPVDAVEVVRCRECQHYPEKDCFGNDCCNTFVRHNTVLIPRKPDDYCSYGKRRESEVSE